MFAFTCSFIYQTRKDSGPHLFLHWGEPVTGVILCDDDFHLSFFSLVLTLQISSDFLSNCIPRNRKAQRFHPARHHGHLLILPERRLCIVFLPFEPEWSLFLSENILPSHDPSPISTRLAHTVTKSLLFWMNNKITAISLITGQKGDCQSHLSLRRNSLTLNMV